MKITDVEALPVWDEDRGINYLFVFVDTDEGLSGVGEAGMTGRELAVAAAVEHFKATLIGEDPTRIEHLWQTLFRGNFFPASGTTSAAIAAIDIALWDIKGKIFGAPLYQLLGGRVRDAVVCYPHNARSHVTTGPGDDFGPLIESCLRTKAEGWKFVRCGVGQEAGAVLEPREATRLAIRQMAAVREAVGDEIEIVVDVHTRLDPPEALTYCREVERYRPYFVEDPLRCENPQAFRTLRARTGVPLAAGEQFGSKWEFRQLVEEELIDYARIDPCNVGGITETRKIAGWCETHYIQLALHNPLGPVCTAACLHLDLATPNVGVQEMPKLPRTILPDIARGHPEWRDGALLPNERPGLGVEIDREAARRSPYRPGEKWHLHRRDGSFTNW